MKKTILMALLVAGLTTATQAQDVKGMGMGKGKALGADMNINERAKRQAEKMAKELGLNDEQKGKWEAAAKERMTANQPLRQKLNGSTTPEERKDLQKQARANNGKFESSVKSFLTPEQMTKFEGIKKSMMEKRKTAKTGADSKVEPIAELVED